MLVVHESSSTNDDLCLRHGGRGPWTKAGPVRRLTGTHPGAARWLLARLRLAAQGPDGVSGLQTNLRMASSEALLPVQGIGDCSLGQAVRGETRFCSWRRR